MANGLDLGAALLSGIYTNAGGASFDALSHVRACMHTHLAGEGDAATGAGGGVATGDGEGAGSGAASGGVGGEGSGVASGDGGACSKPISV